MPLYEFQVVRDKSCCLPTAICEHSRILITEFDETKLNAKGALEPKRQFMVSYYNYDEKQHDIRNIPDFELKDDYRDSPNHEVILLYREVKNDLKDDLQAFVNTYDAKFLPGAFDCFANKSCATAARATLEYFFGDCIKKIKQEEDKQFEELTTLCAFATMGADALKGCLCCIGWLATCTGNCFTNFVCDTPKDVMGLAEKIRRDGSYTWEAVIGPIINRLREERDRSEGRALPGRMSERESAGPGPALDSGTGLGLAPSTLVVLSSLSHQAPGDRKLAAAGHEPSNLEPSGVHDLPPPPPSLASGGRVMVAAEQGPAPSSQEILTDSKDQSAEDPRQEGGHRPGG